MGEDGRIEKRGLHLEYTECLLCGAERNRLAFRKYGYTVVQCEQCGFVYMNPLPTAQDMVQRYLSIGFRPKKEDDWRRLKYKFLVKLIETYARSPGEFLDIGCAIGDFGIALQGNERWTYHGIDINPAILAYNVRKLNITIGSLEDHHFEDERFSVITMWHVLEHMRYPTSALVEAHRVLRHHGLLALIVPDVSHHRVKALGAKWKYLGPPVHLWYFSPKSLKTALKAAGFRPVFTWRSWFKTHVMMFATKN